LPGSRRRGTPPGLDDFHTFQQCGLKLGGELRVTREDEVADFPLSAASSAIEDGTAFERYASAVGGHLFIGDDAADGHGEIEIDDIARPPDAVVDRIAFVTFTMYGLRFTLMVAWAVDESA